MCYIGLTSHAYLYLSSFKHQTFNIKRVIIIFNQPIFSDDVVIIIIWR